MRERIARRHVDKFTERRAELADAALKTLAELGYARTSLREIAQNSGFSHGVLHYYFTDKVDLITHCVKQYKAHCVPRYDQIVADSDTAEALCTGFAAGLAATRARTARCTGSGTTCAHSRCSSRRSAPTSWRSTAASNG